MVPANKYGLRICRVTTRAAFSSCNHTHTLREMDIYMKQLLLLQCIQSGSSEVIQTEWVSFYFLYLHINVCLFYT